MTTYSTSIEHVYYGEHDAMVAEVGAFDFKASGISKPRYTVMANGSAQFDTEPFDKISEARASAMEIASAYGVKFSRID